MELLCRFSEWLGWSWYNSHALVSPQPLIGPRSLRVIILVSLTQSPYGEAEVASSSAPWVIAVFLPGGPAASRNRCENRTQQMLSPWFFRASIKLPADFSFYTNFHFSEGLNRTIDMTKKSSLLQPCTNVGENPAKVIFKILLHLSDVSLIGEGLRFM